MITYSAVIIASWIAFLLVWSAGAFNIKRDLRGKGFTAVWARHFLTRFAVVLLILLLATRFVTGSAHFAKADAAIFNHSFFSSPLALRWVGAVFTALGVLFAIWARVHLGRNWSAAPSTKEGHELVTSGPYRYVRHPIYTGLLLATFGVALTGTTFGLIIFIFAALIFYRRIGIEERIMLTLFPNQYPAYRERTKKLIPGVW